MVNSHQTNNLIDFHVHGIGSVFKDTFATASYDHICAYFQKLAEEKSTDITIALTEHDCSVITFDEYKKLTQKYPNVKLALGMESNTSLRTATDDIFGRAHVLLYADMTNDESIKKWLDCKELKDLSEINTFQLPCNYIYVRDYCNAFNILYQTNLDVEKISRELGDTRLLKEHVQQKLFETVLQHIMKNPSPYFSDCHTREQFAKKLARTKVMEIKRNPIYTLGLKPSMYNRNGIIENLKLALYRYNEIYGDNFQLDSLKKQIQFNTLSADKMDEKFINIIAARIAASETACQKLGIDSEAEDVVEQIAFKINKDNKKPTMDFRDYVQMGPKIDRFGEKLYIAKSLLNKHLHINITNDVLARILDAAKPRENMRKEFIFWVKKEIEIKNPELYKEIKDLSTEEFCDYKFGQNKHGDITINNLVSTSQTDQKFQSSDVRTRLEELNVIAQKTGAHLVLAHPNSKFEYREGVVIPSNDLKGFDGEFLTSKTKNILLNKIANHQDITTEDAKKIENPRLFKLDLFLKLCRKNGINFEGFEIAKSDMDSSYLMNSLIYAVKHNMSVSFGSDTHLSNLQYYYNLKQEGKIDQDTFDKLCDHAYKIKDNTYDGQKYAREYLSKFSIDGNTHGKIKLINTPVLKSHKRYFPSKGGYYMVAKTSLCDKVFNKNKNSDVLLRINIAGRDYEFKKDDLINMPYKITGSSESKSDKQSKNQNNNNKKGHGETL